MILILSTEITHRTPDQLLAGGILPTVSRITSDAALLTQGKNHLSSTTPKTGATKYAASWQAYETETFLPSKVRRLPT
jgi:hypothetical protein